MVHYRLAQRRSETHFSEVLHHRFARVNRVTPRMSHLREVNWARGVVCDNPISTVSTLLNFPTLGNPEERLNADLKQEIGKRVLLRTKAGLREAANEHMAMLERTPERVIGYFQDRRVRYAA